MPGRPDVASGGCREGLGPFGSGTPNPTPASRLRAPGAPFLQVQAAPLQP